MQKYDIHTRKIVNMKSLIISKSGQTLITSKMTTAQLIEEGYYDVKRITKPDSKYYISTPNNNIINDVYVMDWTQSDRQLDDVKVEMKSRLSADFHQRMLRPRVASSFGYDVDGGRTDLDNFKLEYEYMGDTTTIRDSDGVFHIDTSKEDVKKICDLIYEKGRLSYAEKWKTEALIDTLLTIDECIFFEEK